jgi:hypothetical protein
MLAVDFVNVFVVIAGVLVLMAAVMTLVLWQEEGRRSAAHTRATARHTALGGSGEQPRPEGENAELSA